MKYIKIILIILLSFTFATSALAGVITDTPEIFAFKFLGVENNKAKFSFSVKNRSPMTEFNYVLRLEGVDGSVIDERKYDKVLRVKTGGLLGELFEYKLISNKEINRAVLYLTDRSGTLLSFSFLGDLKIKPTAKLKELEKPDCLYGDGFIRCSFKKGSGVDGLDKLKLEIHKGSIYGEKVVEKEYFSDELKKGQNSVEFPVTLRGGYYEAYVLIDGYAKAKVALNISGELDKIDSLVLLSGAGGKGESVSVNAVLTLDQVEGKEMVLGLISPKGEICGAKRFKDLSAERYEISLDRPCDEVLPVAYLVKNNRVLDFYNRELKSFEEMKEYADRGLTSEIFSLDGGLSLNTFLYLVAGIIFLLSLFLFFRKKKTQATLLLVLSILLLLFVAFSSKVSAASKQIVGNP